jgi:hypothetical protein
MAKQKVGRFRHPFRFKIAEGDDQFITAWAKVRIASRPVDIVLRPEHVKTSQKLGGVGNTQTCSMAVCALAHQRAFPHPVEGYIDWQYRRAYVVSRVSRTTGLPTECYVYDHQDKVAHLNDTKGGQQQLLKLVQQHGEVVIRLKPPQQAAKRPGRPRGRNTGERSQPRSLGLGARRRFAMAFKGGAPAIAAMAQKTAAA